MLEPDEMARRIVSARELRGMEQTEVGEAMKAEGYGKHDVAKMERRDPTAPPMTRGRRIALCEILRVPEWWFTADEEALFVSPGSALDDHDRRVRSMFDELTRRHERQYADMMEALSSIGEVVTDHLLPFLAEQTSTPADNLHGADRPPSSSRTRRSADSKNSRG